MTFKPGDQVIIIRVEGARYPPDAQPGTVATVVEGCSGCLIACLARHPYWVIDISTRTFCAPEPVLRKIDGEGRKPVRWEDVPWQPKREAA